MAIQPTGTTLIFNQQSQVQTTVNLDEIFDKVALEARQAQTSTSATMSFSASSQPIPPNDFLPMMNQFREVMGIRSDSPEENMTVLKAMLQKANPNSSTTSHRVARKEIEQHEEEEGLRVLISDLQKKVDLYKQDPALFRTAVEKTQKEALERIKIQTASSGQPLEEEDIMSMLGQSNEEEDIAIRTYFLQRLGIEKSLCAEMVRHAECAQEIEFAMFHALSLHEEVIPQYAKYLLLTAKQLMGGVSGEVSNVMEILFDPKLGHFRGSVASCLLKKLTPKE